MISNTRRILAVSAVTAVACALITQGVTSSVAEAHDSLHLTSVPAATDVRGIAAPDALSPQLDQRIVAQGAQRLENPTADVPFYGYNGDGTLVPDPGVVQAPGRNVEASKTEPDKNTYLRLTGLHGTDPAYSYGSHFLFQGHEGGRAGYITRINLDADAAHRVTLLATHQADGTALPAIDGSTWDPFLQRLLFTTESGSNASVLQATPDVNATVVDVSWALGRGGYEGIQNDSAGNLWIVEDIGGASAAGSKAKNPNSFVYRFVPYAKDDLGRGGKLQALQVISQRSGTPIGFQPIDAAHPTGGAFTDDQKDLSAYGPAFRTRWVTVHDTHVDVSHQPFDANTAAKTAAATPFKRPENGVFRPGTRFGEFYFTVTGDTNTTSDANAQYGGWGSVYALRQSGPGADDGQLSLVYHGDQEHTGLDNIQFASRDQLLAVEDASDTVHTQRGAFDSGYLLDLKAPQGTQPIRFLAEGRDASATLDNLLSAAGNGFQNDGDNEITGIHVSDGDPTPAGILGAKNPTPWRDGWRVFWTQQHGDNTTWEIVRS